MFASSPFLGELNSPDARWKIALYEANAQAVAMPLEKSAIVDKITVLAVSLVMPLLQHIAVFMMNPRSYLVRTV